MALSDITFTTEEMQEMEEAADKSLHRKQHERAVQPPKGTQLAALKLMMERAVDPTLLPQSREFRLSNSKALWSEGRPNP